MKLINKDTDCAVRAILYIEKNSNRLVSTSLLNSEFNISRHYLRKILHILQIKRILKSVKGVKGGFLLVRPADKISLIDLVRIFQGEVNLNKCFFKKKICANIKTCPLRKEVKNIERYVVNRLKAVTIAQLSKKSGEKRRKL
ncbi:MAG: hypothetical protein A2539_05525 [Elusimicrobia bacterium RIFOXYD2_FULL_34_15]|nr:MAG: hypothetical protein A2539_05525 [Elusimicrobia bacterium RIFOXYD2_FULL_34_15]